MRRQGLQRFAAAQRERRREERHRELVDLLIKHRGCVSEAARELGIAFSSLWPRVEQEGLRPLVEELRPRRPPPAEEKAQILAAIRRHHGRLRGVYEELGISKGTLLSRMHQHGLLAEADALRIEHNLTGPRTRLPGGRNRAQRRARLVALLESCEWKVVRAAKKAGVTPVTFYSMMRDLGVERPVQAKRRERLHQLIDALRLSRGVLAGAARVLGVQPRTVSRWCAELDVEPRDYRR